MNESPASQNSAIETSDSLDAASVFRGWKNVFFGIVLACLLLSQAAFWMINLKIVETPAASEPAVGNPGAVPTPAGKVANPASEAGKADAAGAPLGILDFEHLTRAIELINGVLIVAAVLLAASIFFGLMVSLVGRLGGLNHISRAFILSLIAVVLLVPWQVVGLNVLGVTWTPDELARWLPAKSASISNMVIFYLRFTGYWLAVTLLLLLSQARSTRWSKAILRRLEII
jgi:hypothetical protein